MEFNEHNVEYGCDPQCTWARHRETGADGAVLVRPDRFVAWRRPGAAAEPARDSPRRRDAGAETAAVDHARAAVAQARAA
jgi:hypothetical protein